MSTPTEARRLELEDWEFVKRGIVLWLNNKPQAAEESFKDRPASVHIFAGHTFISFMNAVISWETEKMNEAQSRLKELEKQCAGDVGWLKSVRSKLFGGSVSRKPLTESLEEQIILADSQLCLAILESLSQDISGFMKGGWLLRKAWKVYQHTYQQIYRLYTGSQPTEATDSVPQPPLKHPETSRSAVAGTLDLSSPTSTDWTVPNSTLPTPDAECEWPNYQEDMRKSKTMTFDPSSTNSSSEMASSESTSGSARKGNTTNLEESASPTAETGSSMESLEESPYNAACALERTASKQMMLDLKSAKHAHLNNGIVSKDSLAVSRHGTSAGSIRPDEIRRLMGAISFGYGVFQLSISLLPPSLLKLISFLGFEGDRAMGIACLRFSRHSCDMRAPLATLALLCYYTIVTPLFAVNGTNLSFEIQAAQQLIEEADGQFAKSSLFLFFRGRVERLKTNIPEAIRAYELAYRSSAQREIKLLCLHEIGWCRLIQLDYGVAMQNFKKLKMRSKFSRSFYSYLTAICEGAFGQYSNLVHWRADILEMINRSPQKDSQIHKYIFRRCLKLPRAEGGTQPRFSSSLYWKYLVFEMLFLWNALSSCSVEQLESIQMDCSQPVEAFSEPMLGISRLVLGACLGCLGRYDNAILAYRECIAMREAAFGEQQDIHISAFAYYELAVLLLRQHGDEEAQRTEARRLLVYAQQNFRNYDFDNRVSVRIHNVLKRLES